MENARLARVTGAEPTEMLAAALATLGASSIDDALDRLTELRKDLTRLAIRDARRDARRPAPLPAGMVYEPELARARPDRKDHEIRGRLLYGELLGRHTFFQVAAWSIAGLRLSRRDATLLEHLGVNTQLLDPRIWPLAVTRRIARRGAPLARSLVGGIAALFTPNITVEPVAAFMRILDEAQAAVDGGTPVAAFVEARLRAGRRFAGFGRPVLGPDERVPHALRLARRFGRGSGASVRLALAIERALRESKGLAVNSAGIQGAIMRDMGFAPAGAAAFCALYFVVPLLAHHAFVVERR
ncbi:MAG TPA: citrate/2-methylcitrate synthase [Polyangiaceae bacterium]